MQITKIKYLEMLAAFRAGQITVAVWMEFCNEYLTQILEQNRDVFVRLKNR